MDLFGVNGYSLEQRTKLVQERGYFITSRQSGKYNLFLYYMGTFFAEVWVMKATNKTVLVRGFEDETYLETYLQTIDVSALMS